MGAGWGGDACIVPALRGVALMAIWTCRGRWATLAPTWGARMVDVIGLEGGRGTSPKLIRRDAVCWVLPLANEMPDRCLFHRPPVRAPILGARDWGEWRLDLSGCGHLRGCGARRAQDERGERYYTGRRMADTEQQRRRSILRWAGGGCGVLAGASYPADGAAGGLRAVRRCIVSIANFQIHAATIPRLLIDHPRTHFGCAGLEREVRKS